MKNIIIVLFLISCLVQAGHVCSEDELIRELKEDIEDNGLLDCLRHVSSPFENAESDYQITQRIAAQWNSDCSFEAEHADGTSSWFAAMKKHWGVDKLVDVHGEQIDSDFSDQADMCEMVRAILAAGKFEGTSKEIKDLNYEFLDQISCYGDDGQTKVCAATSGSFMDKVKWTVMLEPVTMTLGKAPKYKIDDDD